MRSDQKLSLFIFTVLTASLVVSVFRRPKREIVYVPMEPEFDFDLVYNNSITIKGQIMSVKLKAGYGIALQLNFYDKFRNLTNIEPGSLEVTPDEEGKLNVIYDEGNPAAFKLETVGVIDDVVLVRWQADADTSEGVRHIEGVFAVEITPGDAVSASADLVQGTPYEVEMPETTEPVTTEEPETTDEVPPTTDEVPPTTDEVPPTTDEVPPTTEEVPPTTEEVPPTTEEFPETTDEVPPTTEEFPETTDEPVTTEEVPPTTEEVPPTTEEVPPLL